MDYIKNITQVEEVRPGVLLFANDTFWVIGNYYSLEKWKDCTSMIIHKSLNTFSGSFTTYLFSSIERYKYFLLLLDKTKKINSKLLAHFVELSRLERAEVIKKKLKIPGLGPTGLKQLVGLEDLLENDEDEVLSPEEYEKLVKILSDIEKDDEKIRKYILENQELLVNLEMSKIKIAYLYDKEDT